MDEHRPNPQDDERTASVVPSEPPAEPMFARGSEHSIMEGLPAAKAERVAAMRRDLAELQRQLIEAQQRIATELHGRADDAERFEALENRAAALEATLADASAALATRDKELVDAKFALATLADASAALADAKTKLVTRDNELAAAKTDLAARNNELTAAKTELAARDAALNARTAELEQARRELDGERGKVRDVAAQIARLGQELAEGSDTVAEQAVAPSPSARVPVPAVVAEPPPVVVATASPERPQLAPPPIPVTRKADVPHVEILEVTEDRPRFGSALLLVGGLIVGCAATFAFTKATSSDATAIREVAPAAAPAAPSGPVAPLAKESAAVVPPAALVDPVATVAPAASPGSTPPANAVAAETATTATTATTGTVETATDGTIRLPAEAAGHRLYVDGRVVEAKDSTAVVPCGTREIRIGSKGAPQTVVVACGGETRIPAEPRER